MIIFKKDPIIYTWLKKDNPARHYDYNLHCKKRRANTADVMEEDEDEVSSDSEYHPGYDRKKFRGENYNDGMEMSGFRFFLELRRHGDVWYWSFFLKLSKMLDPAKPGLGKPFSKTTRPEAARRPHSGWAGSK